MAVEFANVLWLIVALLTLFPVAVFYISYRRVRSTRLLLILIAFALFTLKALAFAIQLFLPFDLSDRFGWFDEEIYAAVLDIFILALFTYSLLGPPGSLGREDPIDQPGVE